MYLFLALPILLLLLIAFPQLSSRGRQALGYGFFFITPILTATGALGVLTGFSDADANSLLFGVSFYSVLVAYLFIKHREASELPRTPFLVTALNPFYLATGPFPSRLMDAKGLPTLSEAFNRLISCHREFFTGAFFALILANSFAHFFYLKASTNVIDILVFGLIFELYVYFNFCGYCMITGALCRVIGVHTPANFAHPFGASSVVEYWRRWHISLSGILRDIFFLPVKSKFGMVPAVFAVFLASALWHGVSANFLLWGAFHAAFWCVAYRLHKAGFRILNLLLLPLVVIIGRLIFAENDWTTLGEKLAVVFDVTKWNSTNTVTLPVGIRDKMNLAIASTIVIAEVAVRGPKSVPCYGYLAKPAVQALIALYFLLMFAGFHGEPIYGNR
jgi:alginate O-acetyltransferase complex protein AlgI